MHRASISRLRAFVAFVLISSSFVWANHVPAGLDVPGLRPNMGPGEGYLAFIKTTPPLPLGEERTGWTDARHPAFDGTRDNTRGFDFSDFSVRVSTHTVTDTDGDMGVANVTAQRIRDDFNIANAAYAQAGISVFHAGNQATNGNDITVSGPNNLPEAKLSQLFGVNRTADINSYYVNNIPDAAGYALPPTYAARGGFDNGGNTTGALPPGSPTFNNGFAVENNYRNDTWAHELGHFLLDTNRFSAGGNFHSGNADDLMASGAQGGVAFRTVPSFTSKDGAGFGLKDPGRANGSLGTTSHFGVNTVPLGGGAGTFQARQLHESPSVLHVDRADFAADRADFDWVEDSWQLEDFMGKADNHPGARENLYFIKGPINQSPHTGHDHHNWGELNLSAFGGNTFKFADVVSVIGRYVDMDVDAAGNWSRRDSALDYLVEFSADGANWVSGVPIAVYIDGWTNAATSEDYVARWMSPVDATSLRIRAVFTGTNSHDGNTQIDAVIVSSVPEPASIGLVIAISSAVVIRPKRRWRAEQLSSSPGTTGEAG
jgi:hypothetical protein